MSLQRPLVVRGEGLDRACCAEHTVVTAGWVFVMLERDGLVLDDVRGDLCDGPALTRSAEEPNTVLNGGAPGRPLEQSVTMLEPGQSERAAENISRRTRHRGDQPAISRSVFSGNHPGESSRFGDALADRFCEQDAVDE